MSNLKLIVFIHTCKNYENTRAKILEQTWVDNNDDIIFITDNKESQLKKHIYIGSYPSGPTYHPENVIKMFRLFLSNYNDYDFFIMIDDDSYLYIDKLKMFLSFFDKNESYMIGDFLNWPPKIKCESNYKNWIGGGSGIVFTKKSIESFLYLIDKHKIPYVNHDVWLHKLYNLSDNSIQRIHCPGFHQYGAEDLYKKYDKTSNYLISIHLNHDLNLISNYHIQK